MERGEDGVVLVDLLTEEEYQNKQKFPKPAKVRTESESPKKSHFYMGDLMMRNGMLLKLKKSLWLLLTVKKHWKKMLSPNLLLIVLKTLLY